MSNSRSILVLGSFVAILLTFSLLFGAGSLAQSLEVVDDPGQIDPQPEDYEDSSIKISGLTTTPTSPIELMPGNPRYFKYGPDNNVALIGISGDYLPHVSLLKGSLTQWTENPDQTRWTKSRTDCGYHKLVDENGAQIALRKYQQCLNLIEAAGLNKVRIWVGLNHSPGYGASTGNNSSTDGPFPHEQPFKRLASKWDLAVVLNTDPAILDEDRFDRDYFNNLYEVVKACQDRGLIAEITLFGPWDGDFTNTGPWRGVNNNLPATQNQFTSEAFFVYGDRPEPYRYNFGLSNANELIDSNEVNKKMRAIQVKLMQRVVDVLNGKDDKPLPAPAPSPQLRDPLYNFYWELANEPETELSGATDKRLMNWHYYMAKKLRDYETETYQRKHLIAVNYADQTPIEDAITHQEAKKYIDIVAAHYVRKQPKVLPTPAPSPEAALEPYGAMELIRKYNVSPVVGQPSTQNNKVWGFNETWVSGFTDQNGNSEITDLTVRAEAWEFLFSGGGVYDHLSYRWGNENPTYNSAMSAKVRSALKNLNTFIRTTSLAGMKKSDLSSGSPNWMVNTPAYGGLDPGTTGSRRFWAAMNNATKYLYYIHHSKYSNQRNAHYISMKRAGTSTNGYQETVFAKVAGSGNFQAEWIDPAKPLQPTHVEWFCWPQVGKTSQKLVSPFFAFDIALRIKRISTTCGARSDPSNLAAAINGSTVTASSVVSSLYPAEAVIDGDRTGNNWGFGGGWSDGTDGVYPDWIQVNFPAIQPISEIDIFTLRDDFTDLSDPIWRQAFSLYGITDFQVQYRDPDTCEWTTIPDGEVIGNDRVWTQFIFASVKTDAIRVVINKGAGQSKAGDLSRIVEIEAYQYSDE